MSNHIEYFTNIYRTREWGNNKNLNYSGSSGEGSTLDFNKDTYIPFLKKFIIENNIQSVVDLGCGDFICGTYIYEDCHNIKYNGYDIYKELIEYHQFVYKDTKYNFLHLDFFNNKEDIIDCDLYILKDVLQHWSINDITIFLDYLISHKVFKYILITNCSYQTNDNVDINTGNFRPLSADYLPLKKYNPEILYKYNTKEVSVIRYEKKCIPKVIHICYKELAPIQKYPVIWKQLNPDYEIRLYDDRLCEQFLLENFSQLHCDIFKFIKDGPIKADFWRCCILYKNGGIYADADILPIVPLCEYIDESADFLTCISDKSVGGYNPHLIRCLAGEPLMKKCIETYIEYHKTNKPYGYWEWSVVGIFNIIAKDIYPINTLDTRKYQFLHEDKQVYCLHENKIVLRNRYPFYKNHRFIN